MAAVELIVDGANVVGSRPDGWWRDRPAAARRLAGRIVVALTVDPDAFASALGVAGVERVHLVLEGAARAAADLPANPALRVVLAPADGDATIAALAAELRAVGASALVVTADRDLQVRVRAAGAAMLGPGAFLAALPL